MAWTERLITALRSQDFRPRFLLDSVQIGSFSGGRDIQLSSHHVPGYEQAIDLRRCSISHGQLQIPSFTRTATQITLGLTKDIRRKVRPGQVIRLRLGLEGWTPAEYETVFCGAVRALSWSGGLWSLSAVDLAYSLQSRWVAPTADPRLFASLDGASTTLSSAYSPTDSTINVGSTSGFQASDADPYVIMVTPASGADPFFLSATGKTGTTFTGASGAAILDTTAVAAASGSDVICVAISDTHPLNTIRRILVSTGTSGAHGSRDVMPPTWGYALPPELVDGGDIEGHVLASSPATGSNDWLFSLTEALDDGQAYLTQFLQPGGFYLAQRQGCVTARAVCDPGDVEVPDTWHLADGQVESYDAWDGDVVEARTVSMHLADGSTWGTSATEQIDTRPARERHRIDLPSTWENGTEWGSSIDRRLRPYLCRRGERLTVRSAGYRLAGVTPGDCVVLTTDQVTSRYDVEGNAFRRRRVLCVGGGPDWFRGSTRLDLLSAVPGPLSTQ